MKNMKDKKIRILCSVTALLSVLAVVPIMFEFFSAEYFGNGYSIWGFEIYTDKSNPVYIILGVMGLIALIWNLIYGAYAIIDGRYRNLTWRIARFGYFYGIVAGLVNFAFIISLAFNNPIEPMAIVFLVLLAAVVAIEFVLVFTKDEDTKNNNNK